MTGRSTNSNVSCYTDARGVLAISVGGDRLAWLSGRSTRFRLSGAGGSVWHDGVSGARISENFGSADITDPTELSSNRQ